MLLYSYLACNLKWELKDIHIPLRPVYRKGLASHRMSIARLMASSPQRPYQFTPVAVGRWERAYGLQNPGRRLVLSDVRMPPLPWTGSSPVILLFEHYTPIGSFWSTLALGRCTAQGSTIRHSENGGDTYVPHTSSPESQSLGQHYAVLRHSYRWRDTIWGPEASSHCCERDHVKFTRFPHDVEWFEFRSDLGLTMVFQLDLYGTGLTLSFVTPALGSVQGKLDEVRIAA